jgi:hypothetical protein
MTKMISTIGKAVFFLALCAHAGRVHVPGVAHHSIKTDGIQYSLGAAEARVQSLPGWGTLTNISLFAG